MKNLIKETVIYKKLTSRIYDEGNHEVGEEEVDAIEIPKDVTNGDMKPKRGCSACPHSGSLIDGYKDCPDAYTKQSQYCGFNNKE